MMGVTHGLAGLACAASVVGGAQLLGAPLQPGQLLAVLAAATLAAEAPDLDLSTSRISHGSSTLTAARPLRPFALLLTLPIVAAGAAVRSRGVAHRGATHSIAAAALSTPLVLALYTAYLFLFHGLAGVADDHRPANVSFELQRLTGHLLDGWPDIVPAAAIAWFVAYLSHLLLDDLTTAPQALLWPASDKKVTVLRWPSVPVGSLREHLLVALPLLLITAAIAVALIERGGSVADAARSPHTTRSAK